MKFALLLVGLVLVLSGCIGQEQQPQNVTLPQEPGPQQEAEDFSIIAFNIIHDTPGTRAAGKSWVQIAAIDLDKKRYVVADPENYLVMLYTNGTAYRAFKMKADGPCYVSSSKRDFYQMSNDEFPLSLFLFFESIKEQFPDTYQNATNSLITIGEGEYSAHVAGLENSTYKKYGDSYFGSNVTFIAANESYNFIYSNLKPIDEADFEIFLNAKLDYISGCTASIG